MGEQRSDEDLIRRIARGEEAMFDLLAKRHAPLLLGFFMRRTGDLHVSEDLLQETLIRVFRKAGTFRGEGSFRGWLYAIALNLLRSRRSPSRSGPGGDPLEREGKTLEDVANGRPGPEKSANAREIGEAIRQAVGTLPPRQREVFILRQYQGLGFSEIGAAMSITQGAARAHMHNALAALRGKLTFLDI